MPKRKQFYKTTVVLDKSGVDALKVIYPAKGSLKYFLNLCLRKFEQIHEHDLDKEIEKTVKSAEKEMK